MNVLICSDGTDPADHPTRLGAVLAAATKAKVTLLGVAETANDEQPLRDAITSEAESLRNRGLSPEVVIRDGDPIAQMFAQASAAAYDLVVVGAPRKRTSGLHWRAERTYEVIKAIPAPVLVATGVREELKSIVVCTGGKKYIDPAVALTGKFAAALGASVTLLHVMAEPPAIYADLVRMEEDVATLLASGSELGQNLAAQKSKIEQLGVTTTIRIRHGLVIDQIFTDVRSSGHDMIVTGSSRARGPLRHYIMGDVTREIVNRATVPVLVARSDASPSTGFFASLKRLLGAG
ncbi:MAG: universal stress protein [Chthoniobacterales bacterium]|jgi:nucleotide-binding universal stress UspA family protein